MFKEFKRFWKFYAFRGIITIASALIAYLAPFFEGNIIDKGISAKNYNFLFIFIILFVIANLVTNLFNLLGALYNLRVEKTVDVDLKKRLISFFINRKDSEYGNNDYGKIDNIVKNDLSVFRSSINTCFIDFAAALIEIAVALVIMFSINWTITLLVLIFQAVNLFIFNRSKNNIESEGEELRNKIIEQNRSLSDILRNISSIRYIHASDYLFNKYQNAVKAQYDQKKSLYKVSQKYSIMESFAGAVMNAVLYIVTGILIITGHATIGFLIEFSQYASKLGSPISSLISSAKELYQNSSQITEIAGILDSFDKNGKEDDHETSLTAPYSISIKGLDFSYNKESPKVFRDARVIFETGKINYIVGKSGSGKTTLINLIMQKYPIKNNMILINDSDINEISDISGYISWLPQEPVIFSDTILNNLTLGLDIDTEHVKEICEKCQILNDILAMENGFDTRLTDNGKSISGGQKQRISLARTLIQNRPIVILDEATSAVDIETEELLKNHISEFLKDKLVIVITHSPKFVQESGRIFKVGNKIINKISYKEFIATDHI